LLDEEVDDANKEEVIEMVIHAIKVEGITENWVTFGTLGVV